MLPQSGLKALPIGVANFADIRDPVDNFVFADKTKLLAQLVAYPAAPYFLSRPRRFGKSLLVSTLEALVRGRRDLFEARHDDATGRSLEALWIAGPESDYHFKPGPVISLSLANAATDSVEELESSLNDILEDVALMEELELTGINPQDRFAELMLRLSMKYGRQKVAVLIDEYDTPILRQITKPELAAKIFETLATFYVTLKDCEGLRGFTFMTGVTKFALASPFSGLNNLDDLTLQEDYAAICGLTEEEEFGALFGDRLPAAMERLKAEGVLSPGQTEDDLRAMIFDKYGGYSWDGRTKVLNPWAVLNFFKELSFEDYWSISGSPELLVNLITKNNASLDCFKANNKLRYEYNSVDINYFNPPTGTIGRKPTILMFQTGYLTVRNVIDTIHGTYFILKIPNTEVKNSVIQFLFPFIPREEVQNVNASCLERAKTLVDSLSKRDPKGFEDAFGSLLSGIPCPVNMPYESYCRAALIFALILADQPYYAAPYYADPYYDETSIGEGQAAISLRTAAGSVHVVEIKHLIEAKAKIGDKPPAAETIDQALQATLGEAMAQFDGRRYVLPDQGEGCPVYKTALAVYGRARVRAEFRQADNWTLKETIYGQCVVMPAGD